MYICFTYFLFYIYKSYLSRTYLYRKIRNILDFRFLLHALIYKHFPFALCLQSIKAKSNTTLSLSHSFSRSLLTNILLFIAICTALSRELKIKTIIDNKGCKWSHSVWFVISFLFSVKDRNWMINYMRFALNGKMFTDICLRLLSSIYFSFRNI